MGERATVVTRRARPESDHERGVVAPLYGSCGIAVHCTSARVYAKGVTPGIPDLICQADQWGLTFYHETKVGRRQQTAEQWRFMLRAHACGTPYVLGDVTSANAFLCWLGIAAPLHETIRFEERRLWPLIVRGRPLALWPTSDPFLRALDRWGYRPSADELRTFTPPEGSDF